MPSLCDATALDKIISLVDGTAAAALEARVVASIARESRLLASEVAGAMDVASGNTSGGSFSRMPSAIDGVRNRLFLKYVGVDFEFYGSDMMRYRTSVI